MRKRKTRNIFHNICLFLMQIFQDSKREKRGKWMSLPSQDVKESCSVCREKAWIYSLKVKQARRVYSCIYFYDTFPAYFVLPFLSKRVDVNLTGPIYLVVPLPQSNSNMSGVNDAKRQNHFMKSFSCQRNCEKIKNEVIC